MEFTDEKKRIVREAVRIIHDTCATRNSCTICPFVNKDLKCAFFDIPMHWPLSKKTSADWNYFDECKEN